MRLFNSRIREERVTDLWKLPTVIMLVLSGVFCMAESTRAQPPAQPGTNPVDNSKVIIQRERLNLIDPKQYQVTISLQAGKYAELAAPADGTVQIITIKSGDKLRSQAEVLRLDSTRQTFMLNRAKAMNKAAQLKKAIASSSGDKNQIDLAEAEFEVAQAELKIAQFDVDKTILRAPFDGEIFRVHCVQGQFVKAGEILATFGDSSQLTVEIPVDRNSTKAGDKIDLRIESTTAIGTIRNVLPLSKKFEPLRELVDSAATAIVIIDNSAGDLAAGQTVYPPIIPRYPIVEVPNTTVANLKENTPEGERKVQVIRLDVVRDVPVKILGGVGAERSYISGAFVEGDEIITQSSTVLPAGSVVRPTVGTARSKDNTPNRRPGGNPSGAF